MFSNANYMYIELLNIIVVTNFSLEKNKTRLNNILMNNQNIYGFIFVLFGVFLYRESCIFLFFYIFTCRFSASILEINTIFPCLPVEYSLNNGASWEKYNPEITTKLSHKGSVWVRST